MFITMIFVSDYERVSWSAEESKQIIEDAI